MSMSVVLDSELLKLFHGCIWKGDATTSNIFSLSFYIKYMVSNLQYESEVVGGFFIH